MKNSYVENLIDYLIDKGYPKDKVKQVRAISVRHLKDCQRVEVFNKEGNVIQSFITLSNKDRLSHHVFPFYHRYDQRVNGNYEKANPSCSIAVMDNDGTWKFYDASNSRKQRSNDYIDYEEAKDRFSMRVNLIPSIVTKRRLIRKCYFTASCFLTYLLLHILGEVRVLSFVFPLSSQLILVLFLTAFLFLLPDLLPRIKGFSLFGINFGTENY